MTGRTASRALLIALALTAQPAHPRAEPAGPAVRLPAAVTAFAERRTGCDHWTGEDAYDAARGREIAAAVRKLRCARIDADEAALRRRYRGDPAVLKALDRDGDGER